MDISGQETQIDKYLVERMMDPVLHLVRNAVSHGIESVDERIAAGKPPEGTIAAGGVRAPAKSSTIEIADDGRGVDAERGDRAAPARRGLPVPGRARRRGAARPDLRRRGSRPASETDRVSGRGFGMAVVRSTVQELGGAMPHGVHARRRARGSSSTCR